jgi:hypothetical protein
MKWEYPDDYGFDGCTDVLIVMAQRVVGKESQIIPKVVGVFVLLTLMLSFQATGGGGDFFQSEPACLTN